MTRTLRATLSFGCAALALTASGVASADPPTELSRAEMVARLVESNPDVARAAAAVDRARREHAGARGVLDPLLNVNLELSHARTPTAAGLSAGIATNDRYALSAGIERTFAPGTHVGFTVSQAVTRSEFPLRTGFGVGDQLLVNGPDVSTLLTLEVTQPLLQGFGRDIVLLADSVAAQTIDVRDIDMRRAAQTATLEAMNAYAELRYAAEEVALRRRSLDRTERQLSVASAEAEAGQIAPIELDLVRERLASRTEALVVARAELERRSRELGRVLGDAAGFGDGYRAEDALVVPPGVDFDATLCEAAAEASPEIAALRGQMSLAELRAHGTRDARRPVLAASAGITQAGLDGGWAESVGQAATMDAPTLFGGVVFSTPLRNRAARAEHEVALADIDSAAFEVREAERSLCFEVREAVATLDLQSERIALADARVEIASRAVEAEEHRLQSGLSTVQGGLDALQTLEEAEIAALRVRTDAELAWWGLESLRGLLVEELTAGAEAP